MTSCTSHTYLMVPLSGILAVAPLLVHRRLCALPGISTGCLTLGLLLALLLLLLWCWLTRRLGPRTLLLLLLGLAVERSIAAKPSRPCWVARSRNSAGRASCSLPMCTS
jgi:hypothetical protein